MRSAARSDLESKIQHYSPSQVNTVLGCSLKWAYDKIFNAPKVFEPSQMLSIGSCCHEFVEKKVSNKSLGINDLKKELHNIPESEKIPARRYDEIAEVLFANYAGKYDFTKENNEVFIKFPLYPDHKRPFWGYIDLLLPDQIIDLKLKSRGRVDVPENPRYSMSEYIQQGLYCIATGRSATQLAIVSVPTTKGGNVEFTPVDYIYMPDDLEAIKGLCMYAMKLMWMGSYVPNRDYQFCSPHMCNFWRICHEDYNI